MADYNITKFDNTPIVVPNETLLKFNNSYTNDGLTVGLIGQNYVGFGQHVAQNTVQMLEHFAGTTPPPAALRGQLWFHMTSGNASGNTGILKVWTGADPTDSVGYNANTDSENPLVLSSWKQAGVAGISETDIGTIGSPFDNIYVTNAFVTNGEFETLFVGDSNTNNGTTFDENYFTPVPDSTSDVTGVIIGKTTNRFREVHSRNVFVHNQIEIGNQSNNQNVAIKADNTQDNTLVPGDNQTIHFGTTSPTKRFGSFNSNAMDTVTISIGTGTGEGLISNLIPAVTSTYELGSSSVKFNNTHTNTVTTHNVARQQSTSTIGSNPNPFLAAYAVTFYGTATQANYADLAERYETDMIYPVGTLVKIGGDREITATTEIFDDFIGVISEKPAYLMNSEAGTDETHPAIALTGRIPVRVIGKVKKGQRLITSGIKGVAVATTKKELYFIGFALKNKDTEEEGLVEVVIGAK